jgi:hypothetical protein
MSELRAVASSSQAPEEHLDQEGIFVDPEFPPSWQSIHNPQAKKLEEKEIEEYRSFVWKRPSEFLPGGFAVVDGIDPGDIMQGALGNCYYLCSLAAIAEYPDRIRKILLR